MPRGEKGTARPYLRGAIWWIKYSVPGEQKPRYESSHSANKNDAIRLLNQRRAEIDRRQVSSSTASVGDLLQLYVADQQRQKRRSRKQAEGYVRLHLEPAFGKVKASNVTTGMISRFIETKRQYGYADASINRMLESLRRAFRLGMDALPPLVYVVPKIELLDEDNVREGFLEYADYLALRNCLPDHQRLILVVGYHLGLRRGEILNLRWDQVDWRHNVIRLEAKQTKGRRARVAPLYGELRAWLDMAYTNRVEECPFIISFRGHGISELKTAWQTARRKANLPNALVHDLRRTAVRNMIRAGVPEKMAMLISGHRTRSMFDRYNIVDERDIVLAGHKLEGYLDSLAGEAAKDATAKSDSDKLVH
jgi:integrase